MRALDGIWLTYITWLLFREITVGLKSKMCNLTTLDKPKLRLKLISML